jgi:hypothetical protein
MSGRTERNPQSEAVVDWGAHERAQEPHGVEVSKLEPEVGTDG